MRALGRRIEHLDGEVTTGRSSNSSIRLPRSAKFRETATRDVDQRCRSSSAVITSALSSLIAAVRTRTAAALVTVCTRIASRIPE